MSQVEPKPIPEGWEQVGVTMGKGSPIITDGNSVKIWANGGMMTFGGTPGNKGGGRPKSNVVQACSEGFDRMIPLLNGLADDLEAEIKAAKGTSYGLTAKSGLIRELRGIADTFGKYGPGVRTTNVIGDTVWVEWTRESFESAQAEGYTGPELIAEGLKRLEARMG